MTVIPRTQPGRWSVVMAVAYVFFFLLSELVVGPGSDYKVALAIALTSIGAAIAAAACVTGIISLARSMERSILVMLSTAVGAYCLLGNVVSLLGVTQ